MDLWPALNMFNVGSIQFALDSPLHLCFMKSKVCTILKIVLPSRRVDIASNEHNKINTIDLEIFDIKIFSSFALATKIKNTKNLFTINKILDASATDEN